MVVNSALKRRRGSLNKISSKFTRLFWCLDNILAQLVLAKNTNIDLIKKFEEKKLEEHK